MGLLSGIKILDITQVLSGPFCTMLLADLGAEVVKVERPGQGDLSRDLGPKVGGDSSYFMSVNRGKKSISLDLSSEDGQVLVRNLAQQVDVLVENFLPGTVRGFGLDYYQLSPYNPRLVYASISGFGQDGPYAFRPALDIIVQGMGGMMSVTGEVGASPVRPGASLGDSVSGVFAALAIVSALWERESTGNGRYIDISMLDCQVTLMENAFSRYFSTGERPGPLGSRHPVAVPFQAFETLDGHIVIGLISDDSELWSGFCKVIGHPELAEDPRFIDMRSRSRNYDILEPIMYSAIRCNTSDVWIKQLARLGIPCGPVNGIDQVANDSQVLHRGMISDIPHKRLGKWRVANTPFNIIGVDSGPQGPSPDLGEHTEEVLKDMLGLTGSRISELRSRGVI